VRALRGNPSGTLTARLEGLVLLALVVTSAGGLGLLVGGARPREALHFVYAIVALGLLPLASSLSRRSEPRRQGLATFLAAVIALIVIARLFGTG
jgi:hypothetical protein